jgi:hypothetical protein
MKKTLIFLLLILLVLVIFSSFFWFYEVKYFVGRASISQASFSIDNSYLFVSPLRAKANNEEKIRVTVFVLNNQGLGVVGKKVETATDPNLKIDVVRGLTDEFGKAVFDITSSKAGEYYLSISVENSPLRQKAHLTFTGL